MNEKKKALIICTLLMILAGFCFYYVYTMFTDLYVSYNCCSPEIYILNPLDMILFIGIVCVIGVLINLVMVD